MTLLLKARGPASRAAWLLSLGLVGLFAAGCVNNQAELQQARAQLREARAENVKLGEDLRAMQQVTVAQQKQIATLQGLGDKRAELLFSVTAVKLGRYTGGVDLDGKGGHDGIRVYVRPVDHDGHALKAAGEVKIQLFDLSAPPDENLLGTFAFPVEEIAKHWSAGFMTYHYRFDCPWRSGRPAHPEVTVRVAFTDYFTGKTFTDQKLCKIELSVEAK